MILPILTYVNTVATVADHKIAWQSVPKRGIQDGAGLLAYFGVFFGVFDW